MAHDGMVQFWFVCFVLQMKNLCLPGELDGKEDPTEFKTNPL